MMQGRPRATWTGNIMARMKNMNNNDLVRMVQCRQEWQSKMADLPRGRVFSAKYMFPKCSIYALSINTQNESNISRNGYS